MDNFLIKLSYSLLLGWIKMVKTFEEWKKGVVAKGAYRGVPVSMLDDEQLRMFYEESYTVRSQVSEKTWKKHGKDWFKGEEDYISRLEKEGCAILSKKKGWPDILAQKKNGKFVCAEVKTKKGRLTEEQQVVLKFLKELGVEIRIVRYHTGGEPEIYAEPEKYPYREIKW
jgi:hypothetical protein